MDRIINLVKDTVTKPRGLSGFDIRRIKYLSLGGMFSTSIPANRQDIITKLRRDSKVSIVDDEADQPLYYYSPQHSGRMCGVPRKNSAQASPMKKWGEVKIT